MSRTERVRRCVVELWPAFCYRAPIAVTKESRIHNVSVSRAWVDNGTIHTGRGVPITSSFRASTSRRSRQGEGLWVGAHGRGRTCASGRTTLSATPAEAPPPIRSGTLLAFDRDLRNSHRDQRYWQRYHDSGRRAPLVDRRAIQQPGGAACWVRPLV